MTEYDRACQSMTKHDWAWLSMTEHDWAWLSMIEHDWAWLSKTETNCRNGRKLSLYEETNFFFWPNRKFSDKFPLKRCRPKYSLNIDLQIPCKLNIVAYIYLKVDRCHLCIMNFPKNNWILQDCNSSSNFLSSKEFL